ncbi:hypothetical protein I7I50_11816 [Histoplasma capsulatum G186AR]|uniref:Uncharacterized protein n=1 Tax=Ajellomyces capsulatus TaxID=5037 RepID=A0A8H8D7N9_AJECA|nr:hypothetical protein I7I52_03054 [Histoplasma capsulatum]QSS70249.1 hypothetical protein I7I50_11816 [Histoplasma capsulatum G186AR]
MPNIFLHTACDSLSRCLATNPLSPFFHKWKPWKSPGNWVLVAQIGCRERKYPLLPKASMHFPVLLRKYCWEWIDCALFLPRLFHSNISILILCYFTLFILSSLCTFAPFRPNSALNLTAHPSVVDRSTARTYSSGCTARCIKCIIISLHILTCKRATRFSMKSCQAE